jgi:hypothetical protein
MSVILNALTYLLVIVPKSKPEVFCLDAARKATP